MLDVPDYFIRNASRQFGDRGPEWVAELPSIIAACEGRWNLRDWVVVEDLSINLVCFAQAEGHGDVVVKIQGPHGERVTELTALQLFNGGPLCRCLDADPGLGVMLLERILPGDTLRTLQPRDAQLDIGCQILSTLPRPLTGDHGLPSYREWMSRAFSTVKREYSPGARLTDLMEAAWQQYEQIDDGTSCLLHGDLHHDNILSAGNGVWKLIDPQGVIGPPLMECGRFIQNHHPGPPLASEGEDRLDDHDLLRTMSIVARSVRRPVHDVAAALFVLHILSMCWGYEMGYTQDLLDQGVAECSHLLEMVEGL
jgi:streptomycin 6-kinase